MVQHNWSFLVFFILLHVTIAAFSSGWRSRIVFICCFKKGGFSLLTFNGRVYDNGLQRIVGVPIGFFGRKERHGIICLIVAGVGFHLMEHSVARKAWKDYGQQASMHMRSETQGSA